MPSPVVSLLQECAAGDTDPRAYQCTLRDDQPVQGKTYEWAPYDGGMSMSRVWPPAVAARRHGRADPRAAGVTATSCRVGGRLETHAHTHAHMHTHSLVRLKCVGMYAYAYVHT